MRSVPFRVSNVPWRAAHMVAALSGRMECCTEHQVRDKHTCAAHRLAKPITGTRNNKRKTFFVRTLGQCHPQQSVNCCSGLCAGLTDPCRVARVERIEAQRNAEGYLTLERKVESVRKSH